jgi:putative hydrolase of the HAD superfamily
MPRAVFFDLVGTLMRGRRPIGEQYAEVARVFGAKPDAVELDRAFRAAMKAAPPMAFPGRSLDETARLERLWWSDVVEGVVRQAGLSSVLSGGVFDRFFAALFDHFTTADAWELFPDVLPEFEALRVRGIRLGLITNFDTRVFAVLEALGISSLFDSVTIPAHVGVAKPDRAIFSHAVSALGVAPADAVHVGDEVDDDYGGAEAAGLQAVLIDRSGKYRGSGGLRRIESLSALVT